jgi:hypothetical protein
MLLFMNGDHNTAWNVRFGYLKEDDDYINHELKFTQILCTKFKESSVPFLMRLKLVRLKKI